MNKLHHKQTQKIGKGGRICLWNKILLDTGFTFGQAIEIEQTGARISIRPKSDARRKVSSVMNHGNKLPVIDVKQSKSIDIAALGNHGDAVEILFARNLITIHPKA